MQEPWGPKHSLEHLHCYHHIYFQRYYRGRGGLRHNDHQGIPRFPPCLHLHRSIYILGHPNEGKPAKCRIHNYKVVPHLVDHTSISLISKVNLIGQMPGHFFMPIISLRITYLPCSKILLTSLILTSKLVHYESTTNIE